MDCTRTWGWLQRPSWSGENWIFGHQKNRTFSNSNSVVIMKPDIRIAFVFQVENSKCHLVTNPCPKFGTKTRVPFLVMGCFYRSCQGFSLSFSVWISHCDIYFLDLTHHPRNSEKWRSSMGICYDLLVNMKLSELVTLTGSPRLSISWLFFPLSLGGKVVTAVMKNLAKLQHQEIMSGKLTWQSK